MIYVDRNSVTKSQTGKHAQKATTPAQRPLFQGNLCNRYQVEPFGILIRKDTAGSGNGSGIHRTTRKQYAPRSSQATIRVNTSSLHFTVHTRDAIPDLPTYSVKAPCGSVYMKSGLCVHNIIYAESHNSSTATKPGAAAQNTAQNKTDK